MYFLNSFQIIIKQRESNSQQLKQKLDLDKVQKQTEATILSR